MAEKIGRENWQKMKCFNTTKKEQLKQQRNFKYR